MEDLKAQVSAARAELISLNLPGAPGRPRSDEPPAGHGRVITYRNGCRCDVCRAVMAAYYARAKAKGKR